MRQIIDTTLGAGDDLKAGGDKINGNFAELYPLARDVYDNVASVALSGKMGLKPLTDPSLTPSNVSCATTGVTFHQRIAAPAWFEAFRILIPNIASAPVTGVKVAVSLAPKSGGWAGGSQPALAGSVGSQTGENPNNNAVPPGGAYTKTGGGVAYGWGKVYFKDFTATEIDLPAAIDSGANTSLPIPSWTATDWTPQVPTARTDGGILPLLDVRIQYPEVGYVPTSGASSSAPGVTLTVGKFAAWGIDGAIEPTRTFNGGRLWKAWAQPEKGVDSGINFQGSNNPFTLSNSVPIVVQFRVLGKIHTIVYLQDSIGEFNDEGEYANSYAFRAVIAAAAAGKAVSWCPLTWPSGSLLGYGRLGKSLIDLVRPSILWAKPIGPNDTTTGGALTQIQADAAKTQLGFVLDLGRKYRSRIIIEPHLAVNASWGATDSLRRAWNDDYKSAAAPRGYVFADLDAAWTAGGTVVNGQQQPSAANTLDGVHPREGGSAALAPAAKVALNAALALD